MFELLSICFSAGLVENADSLRQFTCGLEKLAPNQSAIISILFMAI